MLIVIEKYVFPFKVTLKITMNRDFYFVGAINVYNFINIFILKSWNPIKLAALKYKNVFISFTVAKNKKMNNLITIKLIMLITIKWWQTNGLYFKVLNINPKRSLS